MIAADDGVRCRLRAGAAVDLAATAAAVASSMSQAAARMLATMDRLDELTRTRP